MITTETLSQRNARRVFEREMREDVPEARGLARFHGMTLRRLFNGGYRLVKRTAKGTVIWSLDARPGTSCLSVCFPRGDPDEIVDYLNAHLWSPHWSRVVAGVKRWTLLELVSVASSMHRDIISRRKGGLHKPRRRGHLTPV